MQSWKNTQPKDWNQGIDKYSVKDLVNYMRQDCSSGHRENILLDLVFAI